MQLTFKYYLENLSYNNMESERNTLCDFNITSEVCMVSCYIC